MRIENTRMINRPIEEVFEFLAIPENNPEWMSAVIDIERSTTGSVTLGDTFQHTVKFLGRSFHLTFEVIELEPPRRYCVRNVGGPIEFHGCYTLEPRNGQTQFTHTLEGDPGNLFRFGGAVVQRAVKRIYAADLATLNDVLEESVSVRG
jgi:carbon monoxide dehydrogenase subunit G